MKSIQLIATGIILMVLHSACSNQHDVVSDKLITKRKHRSGFHINIKSPESAHKNEVAAVAISRRTERNSPGIVQVEDGDTSVCAKSVHMPANASSQADIDVINPAVMPKETVQRVEDLSSLEFLSSPGAIQSENGRDVTKASKIERRGRWALVMAILQGVCWLFNLVTIVFSISHPFILLNILLFILFFILALVLGWKIRKRNDKAKWAVILAFAYLAANVAISILSSFIGMALFA